MRQNRRSSNRWLIFSSGSSGISFRGNEAGFSLLELLYVFIILAILALITAPSLTFVVNKVRSARAAEEIRTLEKEIAAYAVERGVLPDSLSDINRADLLDPWGHQYQYKTAANAGAARRMYLEPISDDFDLYSYGANGISTPRIDTVASQDDIVRAANGAFVGPVTGLNAF